MSSSVMQQKLVTGYYRTNAFNSMLDIIQIILGYFVINDCWIVYNSVLSLCEHDTFCEWPTSNLLMGRGFHKSVCGNFMFETGNCPQTVDLRWAFEFCMEKYSPHPLFIGITNDKSSLGFPNPPTFATRKDKKLYTGFGLCYFERNIDEPWCRSFAHYQTINGFHWDDPDPFTSNFIMKKNSFKSEKIFNYNELVFGEIDFNVILDGNLITTCIKIFVHPNTSKHSDKSFEDWNTVALLAGNDDLCSIAASIPCGTSIKLKTFDIYGHINFDFRKRIESLYK